MTDPARATSFDTSPRALAERFGELAISRLRVGLTPYEAARLAASYAAEVLAEERFNVRTFAPRQKEREP
jgi:hypothetical protein